MSIENKELRELERMFGQRKFRIKPKRDFGSGPGFWLPNAGNIGTGKYGFVKQGFVVTYGGCNAMPAATWFRTIADAMHGLKVWLAVGGDAAKFWAVMHEKPEPLTADA